MSRVNIAPRTIYAKEVGYSRAVRVGNIIAVAGTAPILPDGSTACVGDLYGQTKRCLEIIEGAIEDTGGHLVDVIRTRVFLTDITRWEEAARAHAEFFRAIGPACTFVEVSRLIADDFLVEIEADCVIEE
jgi:enamine deaminase RidA (YjgF/YER057c/UK114 family)